MILRPDERPHWLTCTNSLRLGYVSLGNLYPFYPISYRRIERWIKRIHMSDEGNEIRVGRLPYGQFSNTSWVLTRNRNAQINRGDTVKANFKRWCCILEPTDDLLQLADIGINGGCVRVDMRDIQTNIDRIQLHV